MNIAIIGTEKKPLPAVRGGAVETLVDLLVKENEQKSDIHLDLYSIEDAQAERQSHAFKNTTFHFVSAYDPFRRMRGFANRLCVKLHVRFCSHVFLNRTIHLLKKKHYDWIIVENRPLFIPKLRRNLSHRTRLALHLHNDTLSCDCFYARTVIARCDLVLSVSSYIEKRVKAAGAHADKVHVLYNRIDTRLFHPANDPRLQLRIRQQCGLPKKRQVVLYYGRLNQGKGVPNLIHAFFHAWHKNPALYLVLLGDYSSKKDQILIQHALGRLPGSSYLLLHAIPHEELPAYLLQADMIALPSLWNEAFGLTIAESMAAGKAVITTNVGAIPELIGSDSGIVLPTDQFMERRLTGALLHCAASPKLRMRLGANARRTALARFRAEGYLDELIEKLNHAGKGSHMPRV
ncbi:glycosyltransferase family 4 protein [Sporolactobacillus terrae]|uniref:Glycosyl transferase family 1 domain-containing protein n=1 Tax=Sporolactobacillus terrae TaxID=269673 RepID=A0ABX5Q518_9BACL|nr:glycosyltransferase family 4 protein [Sporolactobacillus terrae]QAA21733.1 hypothetical protein C0674_03340 [Sporolactobacillus terrae]QAA24705.1 hypothetical protein C0679_03320 [Sporolactobacillus terrae]UAK16536.1 glycosyltransferase family 4 protein [Sporolactobacillus terrae]